MCNTIFQENILLNNVALIGAMDKKRCSGHVSIFGVLCRAAVSMNLAVSMQQPGNKRVHHKPFVQTKKICDISRLVKRS